MLTATFMQLVDVTIVNVAIPSIQRSLHTSYAAIQFVVAGYQMAFAGSLVTAARLGDIFGRRRLFLTGMAGFTAASALCATAPSAGVLIAGRVLLGLMSGLMFPQVLSVIQVVFPAEERARAFAVLGAVAGVATIMGPLAGGGLLSWDLAGLNWRLIFYVNLPVGVLALCAAFARLPESHSPDRPRLDLPGALLVTVALLMVVYPLTEGRQLGWPIWSFAVLFCSLPAFVAFAAHQKRRTRSGRWPLVHTSLFRDRAFLAGLVLTIVFFSGVPAFFFITTLYLQFGFGFSPLHAGLTTFPFAVGTALGSAASESLTGRLGKQVLQLGTSVLVLAMGVVILSASEGPTLSSLQLVPGFVLAGIGVGLVVAPNANLILAGIRSEAAGSASGVLSTGQQVGGVLGIALVGVFFFGLLASTAPAAARAALPPLHSHLTAAGVPAPATDQVTASFSRCFVDRVSSNDPSSDPPSCQQAARQLAASPAPPALKREVVTAVTSQAQPQALALDFGRAYRLTLIYEVVAFALAFLVVFALPVAGLTAGHGPGTPTMQTVKSS